MPGFADRVKDTSTTVGTGAFTLAGVAPAGFRTWGSAFAVGVRVWYCIEAVDVNDNPTGQWEIGRGTLTAATTLARTTVTASSTGALVSFAAGTKNVFCTYSASHANDQLTDSSASLSGAEVFVGYEGTEHIRATLASIKTFVVADSVWTPSLNFSGAAVGLTYAVTPVGFYTKVGKLVFATGRINLSNKGTSVGTAFIGGLPFSASTGAAIAAADISVYIGMSGVVNFTGHLSGTQIRLRNGGALEIADISNTNFTNTSDLYFSATYMAAS